uniref:Uncharacterized protein n=1 Tax=Anguilla anguilla TaxID=7936 RepID=A0A0E9W1S4_ANGAN
MTVTSLYIYILHIAMGPNIPRL